MKDFIAIDLETANEDRSSICEIGITEVVNNTVKNSKSWLVRPDGNDYSPFNVWIHGIKPEDTENSPSFPEVWEDVRTYVSRKTVVAHNTSFDMYALRDAFDYYKIEYPTFDYFCTLRLARKLIPGCYSYSLQPLLNKLGFTSEISHRAADDSLGCARIMMKCLELAETDIDGLEDKLNISRGRFSPNSFISQRAKHSTEYAKKVRDVINGTKNDATTDNGNYFYGKTVCFTGTCMFGTRVDLLNKIMELGGTPTNSVTSKTDVLVVGQQDYRVVGSEGLSSKQKKAFDLLAKGQDIEIISESEFLTRI